MASLVLKDRIILPLASQEVLWTGVGMSSPPFNVFLKYSESNTLALSVRVVSRANVKSELLLEFLSKTKMSFSCMSAEAAALLVRGQKASVELLAAFA